LRERVGDVAAFISLNRYYADFMVDYAGIDPARVHVVPHGLKLAGHSPREPSLGRPPTIGFLARICHDKGLHLLVDALRLLAADPELPGVRLRVAGYLGKADRPYLAELERKVAAWGLADRLDVVGEVTREEKIAFLHSIDVMSVPTVYHESKGLSILEAWANAVPVVLPRHGAFPEMVADTGGGLLFEPGDTSALARGLKQLLLDPTLADEHGRRGHAAVIDRYHDDAMARRTLDVYRQVATPRTKASP
jgi:glycosyltransferase involved in cell wall biosynthesis